MAKNKSTTSKSAGKQKIQAGPSGKMHKFSRRRRAEAGRDRYHQASGKGGQFAKGGPSGKMHKFEGVKAVKKA